jgi:hypothetical protein
MSFSRQQGPGQLCRLKFTAGKLRLKNRSSAYRRERSDHQRSLAATVPWWASGWSRAVVNSAVPRSFLHLDIVSTLPQPLHISA